MTREAFIKVLEEKSYSYKIEGEKIILTHDGDSSISVNSIPENLVFSNLGNLSLYNTFEIPQGTVFENRGDVLANNLYNLLPDIVFINTGDVCLNSVKTLHSYAKFNNSGDVFLVSVKSINTGVKFENGGDIFTEALTGGWVSKRKWNVEGISVRMLFQSMISKGMFER